MSFIAQDVALHFPEKPLVYLVAYHPNTARHLPFFI